MHIIKRKSSEFFLFFENLYDIVDMKIKLLIRRSEDYYNYLTKKDTPCPKSLVKIKSMWDSFFKISYDDYRRELCKIAYSTYKNIGFDEIIPWIDNKLFDCERDYIIVPIDEDDWLYPNIVDILRQIKINRPYICWKSIYRDTGSDPLTDKNGMLNTIRYFTSANQPHIVSSSYAMLISNKINKETLRLLATHHHHMPLFDENRYKFYHVLDDILAIKFGTPASLYLYRLTVRTLEKNMLINDETGMKLFYYCRVRDSINKQKKDLTYPSSFPSFFEKQWNQYTSLLNQL